MAEGTYEYECMRAELLGLPKPEKKPEPEKPEVVDEDEDEIDAETAKELENAKDDLKRAGGGLEELTSILANTQKKLNSFKPNFGSLKDLFQRHLSTDNGSGSSDSTKDEAAKDETSASSEGTPDMTKKLAVATKAANDLGEEMESQVDKLDSLVAKAEYAEMSMASQNKQMRKFLN
ncbi:soluble NSF attachment protein 29 [Hetaerina americana]|uniref:soluble NSF attachment protein 29 n=1 Tax=Hetaerina americana TaxID=62018 RepID=UPI003A7F2831